MLNVKSESVFIPCSSGADMFHPWVGQFGYFMSWALIQDNTVINTINRKNLFLKLVIPMGPHVSIIKINDSKK